MLTKLIKHEFKATSHIMLPLYLILIAISFATIPSQKLLNIDGVFINSLGGFFMFVFSFSIGAICVFTFLFSLYRFYKNLLCDEGYLMFTLPVSVNEHIACKLIVSIVWFIVTLFVLIVSLFIFSIPILSLYNIGYIMREGFRINLSNDFTIYFLEGIIFVFLGVIATCLKFYSSMAIGFSFAKHKGIFSIITFCVENFLFRIISFALISNYFIHFNESLTHTAFLIAIGLQIFLIIFLFLITSYFLKNKLNLE